MDFGVVLQTNPPAWRTVALAKQAEEHGFDYVWTFDSHLLWQEPYVIYSQILAETRTIKVGPMVTNPATRDWTVTASVFATLNEMYGNRTVVRHGPRRLRGAGAQRQAVDDQGDARGDPRDPRARQLPPGRDQRHHAAVPVGQRSALEVWIAAYGPLALKAAGEVGDGFILQLADLDIAEVDDRGGQEGGHGRRPRPGVADVLRGRTCVRHRRIARGAGHAASSAGGSAGWSATTSPTSSPSTGSDSRPRVPQALTDYIKGREGYDYNEHGRAGNTHTEFVPDEIVDRFCLLGTVERARRQARAAQGLGVDQFAVYLQHDARRRPCAAYGDLVIPRVNRPVTTKA